MNKKYTVYLHINKINNKKYVGQTSLPVEQRQKNDGKGYRQQQYFQLAIQKYGQDNFEHKILATNLTSDQADEYEKYYIQYYHSNDSNYGYNRTEGGKFGCVNEDAKNKAASYQTKENREKKSQELKNRQQNDPVQRESALTALRNAKRADVSGEKNPMYGRDRTGVNAGRKRKVQCIETGEIFETIVDAAKQSNNGKTTTKSHISAVCNGTRKTCGKHPITNEPLHQRYIEET